MSYHHDHTHVTNVRPQLRSANSPQSYAAVVGTVDRNSEAPITGRSGDHLRFYLAIGNGTRVQVDVNTRSRDGSPVQVYIADQDVNVSGTNPDEPFGSPAYGVFPNASLSYAAMGLYDSDFVDLAATRLDGQLEAALNAAEFVTAYGQTFDDGGADGKGVHEIHFNPGATNQDGALAIYSVDSGTGRPKRTWFFFKFVTDRIGG